MTVSCIIPAYNEAPRISRVLDVVRDHPEIHEVIVIDDGSQDGTADLAEARGGSHTRVLRQPRNGGKSRAVARGISEASGRHVLLLDSDLVGLAPADVARLIAPVAAGASDVSISLRRNAPLPWRMIGIDYISGERVMPRALLVPELERIAALPGFGLEVFINRLWLAQDLRLAVIEWPSVESPYKSAKHGFWGGLRADVGMIGDMFRAVPPHKAVAQIAALRARRIA